MGSFPVCPSLRYNDEIRYSRSFVADQLAGSAAASYQSIAGPIAARSLFAVLQSTAMGGYGILKVYKAVRAAIALAVTFEVGRARVHHGCSEKQFLIPTVHHEGEVGEAKGCASCVIQ